MSKRQQHRVVCIGGGTGTFSVVSALKNLPVQIGCVIAVSDSGGSTGRIRDEFGFQPVGDLRQSLAALADPNTQEWIQKILLYRFTKGDGLKGHNLGNLLLTALQDMVGDTTRALEIAEQTFQLKGSVIPVTQSAVQLKIQYADGTSAVGEHILDESPLVPKTISYVELIPECTLNPKAEQTIAEADYILIGPGDYYASLMACLMVPGLKNAIQESEGKLVYINNLMTRKTQTHGMTAQDHARGIETACGRPLDHVIVNTTKLPSETLTRYAAEGELPVVDDYESDPRVIRAPLASTITVEKRAEDTAHRSLLRHDPDKLSSVFKTKLFT